MKTSFTNFIGISVSAVAAVLFLCSCQQARLKRVRVAPEGVSVRVQTVENASTVLRKSYVGTVEVSREAAVNVPVSGTLEKLYVRQGSKVEAGQVLAEVSSQAVLSSYDAAMAALRQAEDGYERVMKVYDSGSVPEVKLVEIRTKLDQARASAQAAKNALEQCSVRAPFAGEVSDIAVHQGERVVLAQRLLTIVDAQDLEIAVSVPETEVFGVAPGDKATVEFPSLGRTIEAVVRSRAVVGNVLSHSYKCTLSPARCMKEILPGMVCKVWFAGDAVSGICVPADVVKLDSEGKYVWTVDAGSKVRKTRVTTGAFSGKGVLVLSGLASGDRVIVEGASKVSGGMSVRVLE